MGTQAPLAQGCLQFMLQCRPRDNVAPGCFAQTRPNKPMIWAQSHLPSSPNNCTEQFSDSNEDPAGSVFKGRLSVLFS